MRVFAHSFIIESWSWKTSSWSSAGIDYQWATLTSSILLDADLADAADKFLKKNNLLNSFRLRLIMSFDATS